MITENVGESKAFYLEKKKKKTWKAKSKARAEDTI